MTGPAGLSDRSDCPRIDAAAAGGVYSYLRWNASQPGPAKANACPLFTRLAQYSVYLRSAVGPREHHACPHRPSSGMVRPPLLELRQPKRRHSADHGWR